MEEASWRKSSQSERASAVKGSSPQLEDRTQYLCDGRGLLAQELTTEESVRLFRVHLLGVRNRTQYLCDGRGLLAQELAT
jgi:hypothetical protein